MKGLFRQSFFGRPGGYENVRYRSVKEGGKTGVVIIVNAAERLGRDPVLRMIVGSRAVVKAASSTSPMRRFKTEFLATDERVLRKIDTDRSDFAHGRCFVPRVSRKPSL